MKAYLRMTHSRFLREVDGKRIEILQTEHRPDIFMSLAVCSNRFSSSVGEMVGKFPSFFASVHADEDRELCAAFELVCYRAAEYAEFFETAATFFPALRERRLKSKVKSYHAAIKSHFRPWNLICNRIKHNGNQIIHVRMLYESGEVALGFALIAPVPQGAWKINHDLHANGTRCMSYTRALNQMIYDVCKADQLLRDLVSEIEGTQNAPSLSAPDVEVISANIFEKVQALPQVSMVGDYHKLYLPTVGDGFVHWSSLVLPPPSGKAKISVFFTGDGVSRSFPLI